MGSGHHGEANIEFKDANTSGAKFVEVVIKGLAGADERVFRFDTSELELVSRLYKMI